MPYSRRHPKTMRQIVGAYIRDYRHSAQRELDYFKALKSDVEATTAASRCLLPNGKRHPHQYRIPTEVLAAGEQRLLRKIGSVSACRSFDELHNLVDAVIGPIPGIGELTVYDVSLRIGARLGYEPTGIYLHRGTRIGARALGFQGTRARIEIEELPVELRRLRPRELEDVLCLYKTSLGTAFPRRGARGHK